MQIFFMLNINKERKLYHFINEISTKKLIDLKVERTYIPTSRNIIWMLSVEQSSGRFSTKTVRD